MDATSLTAFFLVALVLVLSPGPDSILILRNTLVSGRSAGYLTAAGVQAGLLIHGLLAASGLSVLLYYSETLFKMLAFIGALYLAYLGVLSIRHRGAILADVQKVERNNYFRQGITCNLLNPKVVILFVALMPSFVNPSAGSGSQQIFLLTGILLLINIPFQLFLVIGAHYFRVSLSRPLLARIIQSLLGGILLFFSVVILINHVL